MFVLDIYIKEKIFNQIKKHCRNGGELEVFGYLVGEVFEWDNKQYIIIEEELFIEESGDSSKYSIQQLEGFAPKFHKRLEELRHERKKQFVIVGWWHSHPDYGCFLSTMDVTTTRYFFSENYHVALVCDPIRDELSFFKIDPSAEKEYKEVDYAIIED
ncbi:MAG: hypothetical protein GY870_14865 [archaeon]|nr:hypothetical protein [archaeon]